MFTVSLDYLENGTLKTYDAIYETQALAVACAVEFTEFGSCEAVFVTGPMGETLYCFERN